MIDDPKTTTSNRTVAVPVETAALLNAWLEMVPDRPDAWIFASENPKKSLWRDNAWFRRMKPRLAPIGLGWANFQALRRTHASIGHELEIDPKVSADQRGHGIGVAIDVYTKSPMKSKGEAANRLERAVLKRKNRSDAA
jgi:integrase